MNAVSIDVSKKKSTVTILQLLQFFGIVVAEPFDVSQNAQELKELAVRLKLLSGGIKVVMVAANKFLHICYARVNEALNATS